MLSIEYLTDGFVVYEDNKKLAAFTELDHAFAFIRRIIDVDIEADLMKEKQAIIRNPEESEHEDLHSSVRTPFSTSYERASDTPPPSTDFA